MNQIVKGTLNHLIKQNRSLHLSSVQCLTAKEKQARSAIKKYSKKSQLKPILISPQMTIRELADSMDRSTQQVFDCLKQINYNIKTNRDSYVITNLESIIKVIQLSGFRYQMPGPLETDFESLEKELDSKDDGIAKRDRPSPSSLVTRPPVVTIMGHVDHGKTTLLDSLRDSHIVESEFGGITQHIGAFNVRDKNKNRNITFLDTPGHAAFSLMRSRGAIVTDIVVLVIAAEDGVMAQTVESINHAKSTGCPIIVAINKIDKASEQQIQNVKRELLKYDLIAEEMGGDVQIVPISALKKTNLNLLKEVIWTQAEIMELKGDAKGLLEGYVIESTQDLHMGKLATVLIKRGTLSKGAFLIAGGTWCKVKFLFDENAQNVKKAGLSEAVRVAGWKDLPNSGDEVLQVNSEHRAKEICELRHKKESLAKQKIDQEIIKKKRAEHDQFYHEKLNEKRLAGENYAISKIEPEEKSDSHVNSSGHIEPSDVSKLHILIKADVNGSLEAILNVLETYNCSDKVILDVVHFEVGPVKKSDIEMVEMFNGIIYCFNLSRNEAVEKEAESKIRHFNVIYKLFDDLKLELNNLAPLIEQEELIGEADILKVFDYNESNKKVIKIAGGRCVEGHLDRKLSFRLVRNGECLVEKQKCKSLKHVKQDVNTIKRNVEFGFAFDDDDVQPQPGDKLVCYNVKMVRSPLDWNFGF
ncbi:Translation initiation factor IF- mitochondrial [Brachionus plicatilis]|uniref:Translation initiation factor IF-mitochondrial n=1 Tax=Brachionus plicatilis TaxID=10195 RepID=A0A3M7PVT8_BRAPC|nr:Translation initiation factor IF- mitochondrial [Brachionus plicatilis]